jgi:hypothetical protein
MKPSNSTFSNNGLEQNTERTALQTGETASTPSAKQLTFQNSISITLSLLIDIALRVVRLFRNVHWFMESDMINSSSGAGETYFGQCSQQKTQEAVGRIISSFNPACMEL